MKEKINWAKFLLVIRIPICLVPFVRIVHFWYKSIVTIERLLSNENMWIHLSNGASGMWNKSDLIFGPSNIFYEYEFSFKNSFKNLIWKIK